VRRVAAAVGLAGGVWLVACSSDPLESGVETGPAAKSEAAPAVKNEIGVDARLQTAPSLAKMGVLREALNAQFDISEPLSRLPVAKMLTDRRVQPVLNPHTGGTAPAPQAPAPAFHTEALALGPSLLTQSANFEGIGEGFTGPGGTFSVFFAPPDPNGAVGPNHYMEIVNAAIAVFNKSGTPLLGPVSTNTLWAGFGGVCETHNDGDGTVNYDRMADRWVVAQFTSSAPFFYCVAVSTTSNPTGAYARYAFAQTNFPDYPKMGVWTDAYYATFNQFNASGTAFLGPEVCAYDRTKMLAGQAATQQCFSPSTAFSSLLPANQDGATLPPAGTPNPLVSLDIGAQALDIFKFHVDFTNPANSTFTGPTVVPVAAFTPACGGFGTCIPQPGETQQLDSLADRLMNRVSYRNFGDHQALVVDHSIVAGNGTGMRWYEVRDPAGTPTLFQQGTAAPDDNFRWMGSTAINGQGSIAVGYSVSSSTVFPSIRATGRLASDAPGTTPQGELIIQAGSGVQNGGLSRWGDYTAMTVDPTDDCTFWYVNQYQATSGSFNWHTRIGSFTIAGSCGGAVNQPPTVNAGPDQTITLPATASLAGTASDDGLPNPPHTLTTTWAKVSGPGTVTFGNANALSTTATFSAAGTYVLSLTGNDSALSSTDTITIVVNPAGGNNPCAGICTNPQNITWSGSFQGTNLGTGARCFQTTQAVNGGNCGNFQSPRSLSVNGVTEVCNNQNWSSVPPRRNGGYCVNVTAGQFPWAYVTLF